MKVDVKVPAAGESVQEADIAVWHKSNGDSVKRDEVLLELETDKASLELSAESDGILEILVEAGNTVKVGQVIARIDDSIGIVKTEIKKELPASSKSISSTSVSEIKKIAVKVPAAGESVQEADIALWNKQNGDQINIDDVLLTLETDKASLELTAEAGGKLEILVSGGTVKVGDTIAYIHSTGETVASQINTELATNKSPENEQLKTYASGHPSPSAAKLMAETNIELKSGTGKDGRITKSDVLKAQENSSKIAQSTPKLDEVKVKDTVATPETSSSQIKGSRNIRREKMTRIRKTISTRLVDAQQTAALLTTFNEVDMKAIMDMRKKYKDIFKEKHQIGLGFMSLFTKASSMALMDHPILNAQMDEEQIIYHDYTDIGIAVATPRGLVVPILRNVESQSLFEIEKSIADFAAKGRNGSLTPDDMTGGTFTITNGGVFGSMLSTPIINRPQSAILGMHNIVERPVAVNGQVEIRPIMYLAVTYDHRIIDGADAVRFLVRIKELIEDPIRLLLEV